LILSAVATLHLTSLVEIEAWISEYSFHRRKNVLVSTQQLKDWKVGRTGTFAVPFDDIACPSASSSCKGSYADSEFSLC
jgi:hypothetical protein